MSRLRSAEPRQLDWACQGEAQFETENLSVHRLHGFLPVARVLVVYECNSIAACPELSCLQFNTRVRDKSDRLSNGRERDKRTNKTFDVMSYDFHPLPFLAFGSHSVLVHFRVYRLLIITGLDRPSADIATGGSCRT